MASIFQVPYAAPAGFSWQLGGASPDGTIAPVLTRNQPLSFGVPTVTPGPSPSAPEVTTPIAPQMVVTFDTIGQVIYSTLGHVRMPLRYLWVKGINVSGDVINGDTITFAAALCAPIDPLEEGNNFALYDGSQQIYSFLDGITPPSNWDPIKQALLLASLATAVIYPGTEGQDPDPTIVLDKGVAVVSAYRGIRYIVLQDYPASASGAGLPRLSGVFQRTNASSTGGKGKKPKPGGAVEFLAGLS